MTRSNGGSARIYDGGPSVPKMTSGVAFIRLTCCCSGWMSGLLTRCLAGEKAGHDDWLPGLGLVGGGGSMEGGSYAVAVVGRLMSSSTVFVDDNFRLFSLLW